MSKELSRPAGAAVVPLLLLGAIAFAAVPLIVGVVITAFIPKIGELHSDMSGWSVLHFIWIYIVVYLVTTFVLEPMTKIFFLGQPKVQEAVVDFLLLFVLAGLYLVFFQTFDGAFVAAAISALLTFASGPLLKRMEKEAEERSL